MAQLTAKTRKILEGLSGQHQVDLAFSFGRSSSTPDEALAFLATQDEAKVQAALQVLKEALEEAQEEAQPPAPAPRAAAQLAPTGAVVIFVCEKPLRFLYNRWVSVQAGQPTQLPRAVALHAAEVARAAGAHFSMQPVQD